MNTAIDERREFGSDEEKGRPSRGSLGLLLDRIVASESQSYTMTERSGRYEIRPRRAGCRDQNEARLTEVPKVTRKQDGRLGLDQLLGDRMGDSRTLGRRRPGKREQVAVSEHLKCESERNVH
jgi:hypothetical protein